MAPRKGQIKKADEIEAGCSNVSAEDSENRECAICLQPCIQPVKLPCSHVFCFLCVKGVSQSNKRCAMCRQVIPANYLDKPNLLSNEQPKLVFEGSYQWFYEGKNGWWQYDERTSAEIETAYQNKEQKCDVMIAGFVYTIDLENDVQVRQNNPNRRRKIKRDLVSIHKKGVAGVRLTGQQASSTGPKQNTVTAAAVNASLQCSSPSSNSSSETQSENGSPSVEENMKRDEQNKTHTDKTRETNIPNNQTQKIVVQSPSAVVIIPNAVLSPDAGFISGSATPHSTAPLTHSTERNGPGPSVVKTNICPQQNIPSIMRKTTSPSLNSLAPNQNNFLHKTITFVPFRNNILKILQPKIVVHNSNSNFVTGATSPKLNSHVVLLPNQMQIVQQPTYYSTAGQLLQVTNVMPTSNQSTNLGSSLIPCSPVQPVCSSGSFSSCIAAVSKSPTEAAVSRSPTEAASPEQNTSLDAGKKRTASDPSSVSKKKCGPSVEEMKLELQELALEREKLELWKLKKECEEKGYGLPPQQ